MVQDISNTLWAYATLRHYPGADLMNGAAQQAVFTIHRFKPQEVANTLWSYATLGHDPNNLLLDAMAGQMAQNIQHFRPQVPPCSLQPGPNLLCRSFCYSDDVLLFNFCHRPA